MTTIFCGFVAPEAWTEGAGQTEAAERAKEQDGQEERERQDEQKEQEQKQQWTCCWRT